MPKKNKIKKYHLPSKDREFLIGNLSLLIKAGVPIGESILSMEQSSSSSVFRKAMQQIRGDIDDGIPLAKALAQSGVVSEQTLALIKLGEESGNLSGNLQVAAKQEEKQRVFRAKVRSALLYPTFVLSLTAIVGISVAWFLLPRLSDTFTQLHVELPLISQIFINFGIFLKFNGLWAVPSMFGGIILIAYILFGFPPTKRAGNTLLFHLPGIARLMKEVEVARFGYLLGTLLEAGLSVTQALGLLEQSTTAYRYKAFYAYLAKSFDEGYSFATNFTRYKQTKKLLPSAVQQIVIAGEKSGSLSESLRDVGRTYEEKADISTQNLEVILEPILLVIVAASVLGVAVAVILPIYQLVGGLG